MTNIGQMHLGAVKIVNLVASKIDKEKSNPEKGIYVFKDKVYIDYSGKKSARPQHYVTWIRDTPHELAMMQAVHGYTPVLREEGLYWPEGAVLEVSGKYKFGDVVLAQTDLLRHLRRKLEEQRQSLRASKDKFESFQNDLDKHGARVSQEIVDNLI